MSEYKQPFLVKRINSNGDLQCVDSNGRWLTIDNYTDGPNLILKEGDFFECEIFPYTPLYFAKENTIIKKEAK